MTWRTTFNTVRDFQLPLQITGVVQRAHGTVASADLRQRMKKASIMDVKTYATIVNLCARFAGRLSDTVLDAVRTHYFAGEEDVAEAALLLGLAYEGVGVIQEEHDLVRSVLNDPENPDLDLVAVVDTVPALAYRFSPSGPKDGPKPVAADELLSEETQRHGGVRLLRTWREPLDGSHQGSTWVYLPVIASGMDELGAYSGLSSRLWVVLHEKWQVEPITDGFQLFLYQAAAVDSALTVWTG